MIRFWTRTVELVEARSYRDVLMNDICDNLSSQRSLGEIPDKPRVLWEVLTFGLIFPKIENHRVTGEYWNKLTEYRSLYFRTNSQTNLEKYTSQQD